MSSKAYHTDFEGVSEILQSLQQQANVFFKGMQMTSDCNFSIEEARENLDSLSKLNTALQDKLQSTGLHAIPLDSEMLQLDCQATVRKGHEDSETGKLTMQRVQMNCSAMNKTMSALKK
ncbi:uncharacterized protein LOC110245028 [Exaiptasia diaphana]|uniref:Uncharacterized protein n=1 Tax=Exaiptasia diaphana TaxID=2652724 RepID=A0A913XN12_EXADI|nr:uncharacterized protein LOC110245028 [Exaiptasia diaphana]KXJ10723.1 hypothetical protein AC249_AIPGENE23542 [Exaiptasia diaphana]